MRSLAALCLYVSLPAALIAADFSGVHLQALQAARRGDFENAAALLRQSNALAATPEQRGLAANDLGVILHQLVRDKEARTHLETAFSIWHETPGESNRLAQTAEALAAVDRSLGDYSGAEKALRTALETPPSDPESYALVTNELGDILREVGQSAEAHQFFAKTLTLTGVSPRRQVDAIVGLADLDRDARAWQSSFDGWNKGLEIAREHHWTAIEAAALRGLGMTYLDHNEFARAEPLLRKSLALFESSQVPGHQISSTLSCLAQLYQLEGKYGMAEETVLRGIKIAEKALGESHPQVAVLYEMLGDAVAGRNQLSQAHDYYEKARGIMALRFGEQSPMTAAVSASWAAVEQRNHHSAEAAADYEKALAVLSLAGPAAQSLRQSVFERYAAVCKDLHRKVPPSAASFTTSSDGTPRSRSQL